VAHRDLLYDVVECFLYTKRVAYEESFSMAGTCILKAFSSPGLVLKFDTLFENGFKKSGFCLEICLSGMYN